MRWVCMNLNLDLINKMPKLRRLHVLLALMGVLCAVCLSLSAALWQQGRAEGAQAYAKGKVAWVQIIDSRIKASLVASPKLAIAGRDADQHVENGAPIKATAPQDQDGVHLNAAPHEDLVEKTAEGLLPKIADSGAKPWIYYSRPFMNKDKAKKIALIISGLGLNKAVTENAVTLSPNFSLVFSSYSPQLSSWITAARTRGHECLLELPLELNHYPAVDPGPYALMTTITPEENAKRLTHILTRATGYVGLVAPRSEVFFAGKEEFIKPTIVELAKRGVFMVFSHNEQRTVLDVGVKESGLPNLHADIKIEYGSGSEDLKTSLEALEAVADERGYAIGIVELSPNMITDIAAWEQGLANKGFQIVPISVLARLNFS